MNSNGTSRISRTPQPMPGEPDWPGESSYRGDGAPPRPDPVPDRGALDYLTQGTEPRSVTVETAFRCRLWERGRLIFEDPYGSYKVTQIFEDYSALLEESDPVVQPEARDLLREQMLTFVPSAGGANE